MKAIARAILRLYPSAWRERYADEVRAMLDAGPVSPGDLVDLARGAVAERRLLAAAIAAGRIVAGAYTSYVVAMVGSSLIVLGVNAVARGRGVAAWGEFASALVERPWLPAAILSGMSAICTLVLVTASPALIGLAVIQRWKNWRLDWLAGLAAACCGAWWQYRMEWFDVWRHGPSLTRALWLWWTYLPFVFGAGAAGWATLRLVPSAPRRPPAETQALGSSVSDPEAAGPRPGPPDRVIGYRRRTDPRLLDHAKVQLLID